MRSSPSYSSGAAIYWSATAISRALEKLVGQFDARAPFWVAGAMCEAVCVPLGIEPPIYRRRVDFFTKSRAFDITRARTEIGYAPRVGLRMGIQRTLAWYRDHGWL